MKVITKAGKANIKLDGDLSVANASDLKGALVKVLDNADAIEIELDKVTSIDFASLQLMCSANLTADKMGKTLTVKDPSAPVFKEAWSNAGFENYAPCSLASQDDSK